MKNVFSGLLVVVAMVVLKRLIAILLACALAVQPVYADNGKMGKRCMACHEPNIQEQVTEGLEWVSGNYYNPLSERDLARLVFYRGAGETEFCLNESCHDITKTGLTEQTASYGTRNPHSWHHSEYTCSDCHKAHRASIMVCSQCHEDSTVPEGWLTWDESQNLGTQYMSWNNEQFLATAA